MLIGGAPFSISQSLSSCIVPNITGPVAIFITNSSQPLANNQQIQFAEEIVMGPTLTFIDSGADAIMQLVRSTSSDSSSTPTSDPDDATSTSTISPAEASSIIAGASSTVALGSLPTGTSPATTTDGDVVVLGMGSIPAPAPGS